jgi:CRP/FNR family transcriptional regulator
MMQKIEPLHSFKNLPPEIETKLRNLLQVHTFSAGEAVFLQGDSPNGIYLVISGRAKITRVTPEGYESILCVRGPGDYFCPVPLLDHGDHLGSAIAINDVTLFSVERKAFFDLCQKSPELLSIVQADCLSEVRHLLNRLEGFAFRQVRDRVAIALVHEIRRQSGENSTDKEICMTQEEIAGLIGASRESVSRNLTRMANDGIL